MTEQPKDHLAPGGTRRGSESDADAGREGRVDGPDSATTPVPADPAGEAGSPDAAARGKATRSPAEVATRPHLEGSEQGPM